MNSGPFLAWRLEQQPTNTSPFYWSTPDGRFEPRRDVWANASPRDAWSLEPAKPEQLFKMLRLSKPLRALFQDRVVPNWMLHATTLAERLRKDGIQTSSGPFSVGPLGSVVWRSKPYSDGMIAWMVMVENPIPTPRGAWQRGWSHEAKRFVDNLIQGRAARDVATLHLARATGLPPEVLELQRGKR